MPKTQYLFSKWAIVNRYEMKEGKLELVWSFYEMIESFFAIGDTMWEGEKELVVLELIGKRIDKPYLGLNNLNFEKKYVMFKVGIQNL